MTYIAYCRVSTTHQREINQHYAIERFSRENNMTIERWVEEQISSSKRLKQRQLWFLLNTLQAGDILITTEISRLSRSINELFYILEFCLSRECQVWTLKENYRLGNDIQSKVLAFAFGLTAELSKKLLQDRTRETMHRLKAEGRTLGRPVGKSLRRLRLHKNRRKISRLVQQGVSKATIAQLFSVHKTTLYRYFHSVQNNKDIKSRRV